MRRLLFVLTVLFVGPASAQSDSHLRAARALLAASNADQMMDAVHSQMNSLQENMTEQMGISEEQKPILDKYLERMTELMKEEMSWEKMEPGLVELYANVYSEQELVELTQFYLSPIGQKLLSKMPELMQASMRMSQDMALSYLQKVQDLQKELQDELAQSKPEAQ